MCRDGYSTMVPWVELEAYSHGLTLHRMDLVSRLVTMLGVWRQQVEGLARVSVARGSRSAARAPRRARRAPEALESRLA